MTNEEAKAYDEALGIVERLYSNFKCRFNDYGHRNGRIATC